jgi:hypothetical protein
LKFEVAAENLQWLGARFKETLKNSASSILDLGKSKTYIAPSVYFPIFSVSPELGFAG